MVPYSHVAGTVRDMQIFTAAPILGEFPIVAQSIEGDLSLRLDEAVSQRALVCLGFSLYISAVVLSSSKIIAIISSLTARDFRT